MRFDVLRGNEDEEEFVEGSVMRLYLGECIIREEMLILQEF